MALEQQNLAHRDRNSVHHEFLASLSDEENEQDGGDGTASPETHRLADISYEGTVSKWTNYLHGWQLRYLVLRDGTLYYYKSEFDTGFGCRGSVSVIKAAIEAHEFDDCRFDVNVGDCIYYLRTTSPTERQKWVDVLECAKQSESGYGSETYLPKTVSSLSLSSHCSLHSSSSTQKAAGLREKLMEMETFRDILCRQMDTMQGYFDSSAEKNMGSNPHQHLDMRDDDDIGADVQDGEFDELSATPTPSTMNQHLEGGKTGEKNVNPVDFRGEAITFKATLGIPDRLEALPGRPRLFPHATLQDAGVGHLLPYVRNHRRIGRMSARPARRIPEVHNGCERSSWSPPAHAPNSWPW